MPIIHIVVLAIVQGITEFLPISSSAHLILVPVVFNWPDQGLFLDVAVHVGTLGAVVVYFWRDVLGLVKGALSLVQGRLDSHARLLLLLILATVPVVIAGLVVDRFLPQGIRSIEVIAWANLVFAGLLYLADRFGPEARGLDRLTIRDAVIIGLAQAVALIPGTSRSGITMTAARFLGFDRIEAARFSLLMSIPTILAAGSLKGLELYQSGNAALTSAALTGVALSFISALIAIWAMMAWLKHASFTPFVGYRVVLGLILLAFAFGVA